MKIPYVPTIALSDVLRWLPNTAPRKATQFALEALARMGALSLDRATPRPAPGSTRSELITVLSGQYGYYVRLRSRGIVWVLNEYRDGRLPLQPRKTPGSIPERLLQIERNPEVWENDLPEPDFQKLETSYWLWLEEHCPFDGFTGRDKRKQWLDENEFVYRGVAYKRSAQPIRSNSGKTISAWDTVFWGSDGSQFRNDPPRNRDNDPVRNWGLGRD